MKSLELSAKRNTVSMILTVLLYGIGAFSAPHNFVASLFGGSQEAVFLSGMVLKLILSILPIYLAFEFGFKKAFKFKPLSFCGLLFCIPAFIVALDNFPFLPVISGYMSINGDFLKFACYVAFCFSIAVLEESVFRANVLPLCMYKFKKDKKGTFFAIALSSAIFGATHLLNLLSGFSPAVFLQAGYSTLIGATCALAMLFTGRFFVPVLIHFIFDAGGFLSDHFATGPLWTIENVILTAVVSVICGIFLLIFFLKHDFSQVYDEWGLNDIPPEKGN